MKMKKVFVVTTPRTIMGIYESKYDALERIAELQAKYKHLFDDVHLSEEYLVCSTTIRKLW